MKDHILKKIRKAQKKHGDLIKKELNILNSSRHYSEKKLIDACKITEKISAEIRLLKAELYKDIINRSNDMNKVISIVSEKEFPRISDNDRLKIFALFEYYHELDINYDKSNVSQKIISGYTENKCSLDEILEALRIDYRDL